MSTSNIWLCLHFPKLPVEVFVRGRENSPVVITKRQRVVFINDAAAASNIAIGSSMNTAYAVTDTVVSFEQDETKELDKLEQLAQWSYQFTPSVAIRAPHSLLLDVTGCIKLFNSLDALKARISNGLAKMGFSCMIAAGSTPLTALSFAEAGQTGNLDEPTSALGSLPINSLRIDERIRTTLSQMGIITCGELLALPRSGLNRRFGVFFSDYLARLVGEKADPQKFIGDRPRFRSDVTFTADVTNLTSLVFPLKRLISELHQFLIGRQLIVNQFSLRLSHRSHPSKTLTVFLARPDADPNMFLMLSQLQLEKIQDIPEVDNLALAANEFFPAEATSGDLFQGNSLRQKDATDAAKLINMLTARLGSKACFGLSEANDHRPERAWKTVNLATRDYWPKKHTSKDQRIDSGKRPLFLLPEPKRLACLNGRPALSGQLELLQGPERIDFGWWDDDEVARDYFIARHHSGTLYWVFKQLREDNWYLHGIFS